MKDPEITKKEFLSRALWYSMAAMSTGIVGLAVFFTRSFSASKFITLGVAIMVGVLVSRHDLRIPTTKLYLSAKDLFAFWGIIWLGISGGILLGLSATVATCYFHKYEKKRFLLQTCTDSISVFVAAVVYYLASNQTFSYQGRIESVPVENLTYTALPLILMVAVHFFLNSTLFYLGCRIIGELKVRQVLREAYLFPITTYLLTIAATFLADYTFGQFGIEFGLVILPVAVLGSVAHTIHQQRLANKTKQISDASRIHLATVEALATAIDARDQTGIGHVRRTQIFAIGLGEFLDLEENLISALRTAALLHDIGKLAVPDHILNKPGPLTQAEIEKTKIHSSVGASILEKVGFDTPVVPTVKYHHEHWDGSGYPEALKGENIPLTARILAVADAYDTLRGPRPYRPPVSKPEACSILRKEAGLKFDPVLVQIFLDNLERFETEISRQGLSYRSSHIEEHARKALAGAPQQNYVEQIKLANREAFTLYELAKEFSSALNLGETLTLLTEKIREFVQFDTCTVYLMDEKSGTGRSVHVAGKHAPIFHGHEVHPGEGITGRVLANQSIARNCDPWPDLELLRSGVTINYRSMVSLPLLADGKMIGAVSLYSTDNAAYSDEHLRLLETITRIASDAVEKSQRHAEAETHALTDPMTGLPNARSLQMQFEREVARARRAGRTFQVLMLDLDGFKQVNDTFGHKAGDKMLVEVGGVIRDQLREYDFLARYAGDEFVAMIPDTSAEAVYELCRRIEDAVGEFSLNVGHETAQVGVSIGYATYPYSGEGFDQLLIAADSAMYSAKSRRKRAEVFGRIIPKPDLPLEFDAPANGNPDDVDTIVEGRKSRVRMAAVS